MTQVFVDPERLRSFSRILVGYAEQTGTSLARLQAQLQRLGSTWRDQEYDQFAQDFRKTKAQLAALQVEIDKLVPVLESDAAKASDIHRS